MHIFCYPHGALTSQWQLDQEMKQHVHAFFRDTGDKGSQDVYGPDNDCHAVTEALEAYQSPRLLHSSKGHFLHCPPRLGNSAKALPAERKTLSCNAQLLYSMLCSLLRHYSTSQQQSNEGSGQLQHHQSVNSRYSRKQALRQAITYVGCLRRLVFVPNGMQRTWEPSTQCCTYGRKMLYASTSAPDPGGGLMP